MFRSRRWRKLLNLIDGLPRNSEYQQALSEDDQLADLIAQGPDPEPQPKRRLGEFSVEVELLTVIADRLAEVAQVIAASRGAKPRQITPLPRPVSAIDRARTRKRETRHRELVARVLPQRAQEQDQ